MTSEFRRTIKLALFGTFGLFLAWQVVSGSLVAYLAGIRPGLAVSINPSDAGALSALAIQRFGEAQRAQADKTGEQSSAVPLPAATAATIRDLAERALRSNPLDTRALAVLGLLAEDAGDIAKAKAFMSLAADQSRREAIAELWLFNDAWRTRKFDEVAARADALLRTRTQIANLVVPVLARAAEDPAGIGSVQRLLATAPPWRKAFFATVSDNVADPLTPMTLLLALKGGTAPPTTEEFAPYLRFLVERKLFDNARYVWLQSLGEAQLTTAGLVFNGGFETQPSGVPFDWIIRRGAGVYVDFIDGPDVFGKRALRIELKHGRVEFGSVDQTLVLAPGSYRLTAKVRGEFAGRRGLQWLVSCLSRIGEPIAATPMFLGVARGWQDIGVGFTVPATGCEAQRLALVLAARSSSEQLVTGEVWYDNVRIEVVDTTKP